MSYLVDSVREAGASLRAIKSSPISEIPQNALLFSNDSVSAAFGDIQQSFTAR